MAQLDVYRGTLARKRDDLTKLHHELAREQEKISKHQKAKLAASNAIRRTNSESTVKSRQSEIARAETAIVDAQKKCTDIQKKIAKKEQEVVNAERLCRAEEDKVGKKETADVARRSESMLQKMHAHEETQRQMQTEIERLKAIPLKITVLFMAANPTDTQQLRLDEEARAIQRKIRLSEFRNSIDFQTRWATRASDILQAINETNPTIVHFSGHGDQSGELVLQNPDGSARCVTLEAISSLIATASSSIRLVVFNSCFSKSQAERVVEHIEAAIGMADSIGDDAACAFAAQLYSSIGFGLPLKTSFDQAIVELLLEGIPGENIPQIFARPDVDLDSVILVQPIKPNDQVIP